jgi:hypothetical protein
MKKNENKNANELEDSNIRIVTWRECCVVMAGLNQSIELIGHHRSSIDVINALHVNCSKIFST